MALATGDVDGGCPSVRVAVAVERRDDERDHTDPASSFLVKGQQTATVGLDVRPALLRGRSESAPVLAFGFSTVCPTPRAPAKARVGLGVDAEHVPRRSSLPGACVRLAVPRVAAPCCIAQLRRPGRLHQSEATSLEHR